MENIFTKADIGSELLSVLTRGIYLHPLDTIREYVQNSIDARSNVINIKRNPHSIVIVDDGSGMNEEDLSFAKKLGISRKDPSDNVGFRGIGLYSAFPYCDKLILITRQDNSKPLYLQIDFKLMRIRLQDIEESRFSSEFKSLSLVDLLNEAIVIGEYLEYEVESVGTKVILSGLNKDMYDYVNDDVRFHDYLENTIPLKLNPSFNMAELIASKHPLFSSDRTVIVDGQEIYKPYKNDIFGNNRGVGPIFYPNPEEIFNFGINVFAWVAFNDNSKPIQYNTFRGLLVKYKGFSIGDRNYLKKFSVNHSKYIRITGEIVIESNDELRPLAGREDFEPSKASSDLMQKLSLLLSKISDASGKVYYFFHRSKEIEDHRKEIMGFEEELNFYTKTDKLLRIGRLVDVTSEVLSMWKKAKEEYDKLDVPRSDSYISMIEAGNQVVHLCDIFKEKINILLKSQDERTLDEENESDKMIDEESRKAQEAIEKTQSISSDEVPSLIEILISNGYIETDTDIEFSALIKYLDSVLEEYLTRKEYRVVISKVLEILGTDYEL